jgi:hypothetical protein
VLAEDGRTFRGESVADAWLQAARALEAEIPAAVPARAALALVRARLAGVPLELRAPDTAEGRAAVAAVVHLAQGVL